MWQTAQEKAKAKIEGEFKTELKDLQEQFQEKAKLLEKAELNELDLRKKTRELEEQKRNLDLEMQRKMDEERIKIAAEARKTFVDHLLRGHRAGKRHRQQQGRNRHRYQRASIHLILTGSVICPLKVPSTGKFVSQSVVRLSATCDMGEIRLMHVVETGQHRRRWRRRSRKTAPRP